MGTSIDGTVALEAPMLELELARSGQRIGVLGDVADGDFVAFVDVSRGKKGQATVLLVIDERDHCIWRTRVIDPRVGGVDALGRTSFGIDAQARAVRKVG